DRKKKNEAWEARKAEWAHQDAVKAKWEDIGAEIMKDAQAGNVKGADEIEIDYENLPPGVSDEMPEATYLYQKEIERNDTGNGQLFAAYWGHDVIHVTPKGFDWHTWNGSIWTPDEGEKQVLTLAKETAARIKDQILGIKKPEALKDDATDQQKAQHAT